MWAAKIHISVDEIQMTWCSRRSSAQGTHTVNQLLQTLQRLYAGEYNGPLRRNSRDTTDA